MSLASTNKRPEQQVGRYAIFDEIAAGGMATVHLARLVGSGGFSRVVAAKRMHRHLLREPGLKTMFLAEARLAARIVHPNVVPILDVLSHEEELIIVMEYIHGESLLALLRKTHQAKQVIPGPIGCAIVAAVLEGLHAAHEAQNEKGAPLGIVHRDVSPQNVIVGADGVARVLDFGIAKALQDQQHTNPGTLKGKYSYMALEVVKGAQVTRQADVFSAGIVLWEVLAGKMLFGGSNEHDRMMRIVAGNYPSPRVHNPTVPTALEKIVAKALAVEPNARYATALEFALAVESSGPVATRRVVSEWVRRLVPDTLDHRESLIQAIETSSTGSQAELPITASRLEATPPPIAVESPFAGDDEPAGEAMKSRGADSADYAAVEVDRAESTARFVRWRSPRILAATAGAVITLITLVLLLRGGPAKIPAASADPANPITAEPAAAPPVEQPTVHAEPPPTEATPPPTPLPAGKSVTGRAATNNPPSEQRPTKRATGHGKHYLPNKL